jgi:hypothetical protein
MNRLASRRAAYAPRQQPGSGANSKLPTSPGSGGHLEVATTPGSGGHLEVIPDFRIRRPLGGSHHARVRRPLGGTRTRTNTNPKSTEASAASRSVRACVARKSKREESCGMGGRALYHGWFEKPRVFKLGVRIVEVDAVGRCFPKLRKKMSKWRAWKSALRPVVRQWHMPRAP